MPCSAAKEKKSVVPFLFWSACQSFISAEFEKGNSNYENSRLDEWNFSNFAGLRRLTRTRIKTLLFSGPGL
jgi:hypothetical protein